MKFILSIILLSYFTTNAMAETCAVYLNDKVVTTEYKTRPDDLVQLKKDLKNKGYKFLHPVEAEFEMRLFDLTKSVDSEYYAFSLQIINKNTNEKKILTANEIQAYKYPEFRNNALTKQVFPRAITLKKLLSQIPNCR